MTDQEGKTMTETAVTRARSQFDREVAQHALTVLHDEGVYRHLRLAAPGDAPHTTTYLSVAGSAEITAYHATFADAVAWLDRNRNRLARLAATCAYRAGLSWEDRHGDVWTLGNDGLMHTPETAPFPWDRVVKKWGPLTLIRSEGERP